MNQYHYICPSYCPLQAAKYSLACHKVPRYQLQKTLPKGLRNQRLLSRATAWNFRGEYAQAALKNELCPVSQKTADSPHPPQTVGLGRRFLHSKPGNCKAELHQSNTLEILQCLWVHQHVLPNAQIHFRSTSKRLWKENILPLLSTVKL